MYEKPLVKMLDQNTLGLQSFKDVGNTGNPATVHFLQVAWLLTHDVLTYH